jgi:hypothetical protein
MPLKALFSALFGTSNRLTNLEKRILESVRDCLDECLTDL